MFGALMLELYPIGRLGGVSPNNAFDPLKALNHFDGGNYSITYQEKLRALWVQGGPRARSFFADQPRKAMKKKAAGNILQIAAFINLIMTV